MSSWVRIKIHGLTTESPTEGFLGIPAGFHLLRNLSIKLILSHEIPTEVSTMRRMLAILCDELVCRCQKLRSIVIKLVCTSCMALRWDNDDPPEASRCISPQSLEKLLQPLEKVRPSHSIEFDCGYSAAAELAPAFERVAAGIRSLIAQGRSSQQPFSVDG